MSVTTFFTRVDSAHMGGQVAALASITIVRPPQSCASAWRGSLSLDRQRPVFGQGCTNSYVLLLKPVNLLSNSTSKRASDVAPWGSICLAYAISSTTKEKVACVTHEYPTALVICFKFFPCVFFHWTLLGPHLFIRPQGLEENRTISTDYQEASRLFCYFISASIGSLTTEHKTNKTDEMNQSTQGTISSTRSLASNRENYQLPRAHLLSLGVSHSMTDECFSKGPG